MAKNHLDNNCTAIPEDVRNKLLKLKETKRRAGGGKTYWADSAKFLGIFEDQYGLRFSKDMPEEAKNASSKNDTDGAVVTNESVSRRSPSNHASSSSDSDDDEVPNLPQKSEQDSPSERNGVANDEQESS